MDCQLQWPFVLALHISERQSQPVAKPLPVKGKSIHLSTHFIVEVGRKEILAISEKQTCTNLIADIGSYKLIHILAISLIELIQTFGVSLIFRIRIRTFFSISWRWAIIRSTCLRNSLS